MSARRRKERDVFDDLPGATPALAEDFHQACPNCDRPLVIRADQPIRRVACDCGQTFTLDKRIGGELCLLRVNAREYAGHRAAVATWKEWRLRVVALLLAVLLLLSLLAALEYTMLLAFAAPWVLAWTIARGSSDRDARPRRGSKRRLRRRSRRGGPVTG